MFAVFQSGGKQHRVSEGDVVKLELLKAEPGEEVVFDQVLMVANGDDVNVGEPYVEGSQVKGEVLRTDRGKKVRIINAHRTPPALQFLDPAGNIEVLGDDVEAEDISADCMMVLDTSAWAQLGDCLLYTSDAADE